MCVREKEREGERRDFKIASGTKYLKGTEK